MKNPFEQVWAWVRKVPRGKVVTYGQLSLLITKRMTPVGVGWAMAAAPADVPWHRVVNAKGGISTKDGRQRALLSKERVRFREDGCVDLETYQWRAKRPQGMPARDKKRPGRPAGAKRAKRRPWDDA